MLTKTDKDIIISYLEDYSNLKGGFAEAVVIPESESDIIVLLKDASQKHTPVAISGAGTGVTGGRIPFGGIVVSLEKLNKIVSMGSESAILQAGVRLEDLHKELEKKGLFYQQKKAHL